MCVGNGATTKCETSKEIVSLSRKNVDGMGTSKVYTEAEHKARKNLEEGTRKTKGLGARLSKKQGEKTDSQVFRLGV